jgi:hypothetical protein
MCFITLSDAQELAEAVTGIQMPSTYAVKCTCSHTPPEDLLEANSTYYYSPTPGLTFLASQSFTQTVTTEYF